MKITQISPQIKDKSRYSIFVDGEYSFSFSESGLLKSGIKIGLELTTAEFNEFKRDSATDKLLARTLNLLARRPRSKWEIEQYLKRKTNDVDEIEKILNALSKYINDEDFASRWVANRRLLKPISKRKLQLELQQKHIPTDIIQRVLNDDETDEHEVLKELINKKRTQTRYQDDLKLMQYLTRQGFNYSDIKQAMQELS